MQSLQRKVAELREPVDSARQKVREAEKKLDKLCEVKY